MVRKRKMLQSFKNMLFFKDDGFIGLEEYRYDCVTRQAVTSVDDIDKAFAKISESGGVTRTRYQQLFAEYLGDTDTSSPGCALFGPLPAVK